MPAVHLSTEDPFSLILANDYRLNPRKIDFDTVWEVQFGGGDQNTISLYTTLSLRALSLRIFPIFSNLSTSVFSLNDYENPPEILKYSSSYARCRLTPFQLLDTEIEYWVPDSNILLGKVTLNNQSLQKFEGSSAWAVQLNPQIGGSGMVFSQDDQWSFLSGTTQNIGCIFLANGAPQAGKFGQPSLEIPVNISPGSQITIQWVFCWAEDQPTAMKQAKLWLNHQWNADLARMDIFDQRDYYQFETGNPDWDNALNFSQRAALSMLLPSNHSGQEIQILNARHPEQNPLLGENTLSSVSSSGMTPLDLWYFAQLLPDYPQVIMEMFNSFLNRQTVDGGMGNFSEPNHVLARFQAFPILTTLACQIFQQTSDRDWIKPIVTQLESYLNHWLSPEFDQDQDGFPEWSHPLQTLYEILPIINRYHPSGEGIDTGWIESPMLPALLAREIDCWSSLVNQLGYPARGDTFKNQKDKLVNAIQSTWNGKKKRYFYRDSIQHTSHTGYSITSQQGSGQKKLNKKLRAPQRLCIKINCEAEHTHHMRVYIHGTTIKGRTVEEITTRQIHWSGQIGYATSQHVYQLVKNLEVEKLAQNDHLELRTVDYASADASLLLPLWSRSIDQKKAKALVENWLVPQLLQPYGIPYVPISHQPEKTDIFNSVDFPLNTMIMDGLIEYGFYTQAREIFTNMLSAVIKNLKLFKRFQKLYDASDGYGTSDYNIINGMIPVRVFLKLLGIQKWSKSEILIDHSSLFEQDITIVHRGYQIICHSQGHTIQSPGGKTIETHGNGPHQIQLPG
ncbi:MAG: hypothetical protein CVU39_05280 [Chloroflexi bacterium HGW-Chloroflexi-10]|nr:MAG: hypothetical protein CVU39_05280 [Chloroflexi bacterium HGW-Chloroflexi-10]